MGKAQRLRRISRQNSNSVDMQRNKRINVLKEIKSSEQVYVKQLELIVDLYITPLKESRLITEDEIISIFSNINQIKLLNGSFLQEVSRVLDQEDIYNCSIGIVFLTYSGLFKMYKEYVNNHEFASQVLESIRKRDKVQKLFSSAAEDSRCNGAELESLLITPIQRIPRYKLLLQNLLEATPKDMPDFDHVQSAIQTISKVAWEINDHLQQSKNIQELLKLQSEFKDDVMLVSPSRRLVRQGKLVKKCRFTDKEFTFFLFNDMLMYAHGGLVNGYVLHRKIAIGNEFKCNDLPDLPDQQNRFEILNHEKSFIMYANSLEEKMAWLDDINLYIDEYQLKLASNPKLTLKKPRSYAPICEPVNASSLCKLCSSSFSIVRRKHHCSKCGKLVCNDCSKSRMRLDKGETARRVCDKCVSSRRGKAKFFNDDIPIILPRYPKVYAVPSSPLSETDSGSKGFPSSSKRTQSPSTNSESTARGSILSIGLRRQRRQISFDLEEGLSQVNESILNEVATDLDQENLESSSSLARIRNSIIFHTEDGTISYSDNESVEVVDEFHKHDLALARANPDRSLGKGRERRGLSLDLLGEAEYYPGDVYIALATRKNEPSTNGELDIQIGDEIRIQKNNDRRNSSRDRNWLFGQSVRTLRLGWVYNQDVLSTMDYSEKEIEERLAEASTFYYKAIRKYAGDPKTFELKLDVDDRVTIEEKHKSGYWYGYNHNKGTNGWIDPQMLERYT